MQVNINGEIKEVSLREAWNYLTPAEWKKAVREAELSHFRNTHRFCGCCGATMAPSSEISMKCEECGHEDFPSLSPAVLVLVTRKGIDGEREALLVHARSFSRQEMFALVAGFVETGETIEECVAREVKEETSLDIDNIRYYASQSWPFPSQLMIAFTANYAGGEIKFADNELSAGGWFTRIDPPQLPTLPSLSRQLIDEWLAGNID